MYPSVSLYRPWKMLEISSGCFSTGTSKQHIREQRMLLAIFIFRSPQPTGSNNEIAIMQPVYCKGVPNTAYDKEHHVSYKK